MFGYYFALALHNLSRNKVLTTLIVLAMGLGVGASMTMLTVIHVMSGDPLPDRSTRLYVPQIDPRPLEQGQSREGAYEAAPDSLTWVDAAHLLQAHQADRQAAMAGGSISVYPLRGGLSPFFQSGRYVTAAFFPMFGLTFRAGGGWTAQQDDDRARVVVLDSDLAHKLFGDEAPVGRAVRLKDADFRVIGVVEDWDPQPKFYAQPGHGVFGEQDHFFLPLQTAMELKFNFSGRLSCWGSDGGGRNTDHCTWLQFWVQLDSGAKVLSYGNYLADYWHGQRASGRFPRPVDARLYTLMDWLTLRQLIPGDLRLQLSLALGFLAVCIVNIVGLLLAKYTRRSGEVSVRRALGARHQDILVQLSVESAVLGGLGGGLGLVIAEFGLWTVRQRPDGYAHLAQMDWSMLTATIALGIGACLVAGLLPGWRISRTPPALQLKNQ